MTRRGLLSILPAFGLVPETMTVAAPVGRIPAIVTGATVGSFFIHRTPQAPAIEGIEAFPEWTVAHKATGNRVWWFKQRDTAVRFAKLIEPMGPWATIRDRDAARNDDRWRAIGRRVYELADELEGL